MTENTDSSVVNGSYRKEMIRSFLFALLTAVGAQMIVPAYPVPFTLQSYFVMLSGVFLGSRWGAVSQLIYLGLGAVGIPVFADLSGGYQYLTGVSGGYLIAFPVCAYITGLISEQIDNWLGLLLGLFIGTITILIIGSLFMTLLLQENIATALYDGLTKFTEWSSLKLVMAFGTVMLYRYFRKVRNQSSITNKI